MSLVSNLFILFVAASVLIYYLVPRRFQWIVLLAFSYIYYIAGGPRYVVFILFSTIVTWLLALLIEKTEGNGNHKGAKKTFNSWADSQFRDAWRGKVYQLYNREYQRPVSFTFKRN